MNFVFLVYFASLPSFTRSAETRKDFSHTFGWRDREPLVAIFDWPMIAHGQCSLTVFPACVNSHSRRAPAAEIHDDEPGSHACNDLSALTRTGDFFNRVITAGAVISRRRLPALHKRQLALLFINSSPCCVGVLACVRGLSLSWEIPQSVHPNFVLVPCAAHVVRGSDCAKPSRIPYRLASRLRPPACARAPAICSCRSRDFGKNAHQAAACPPP